MYIVTKIKMYKVKLSTFWYTKRAKETDSEKLAS
jgi:hypothetical protein